MTIDYSIILNIKICNIKPSQLPVLNCFYIMCRMYTNIGMDFFRI